jgi:BirA family transcriptional regulator, biotin operon repressor / biotin---[acetyl-CoA-carboxylase] ligase
MIAGCARSPSLSASQGPLIARVFAELADGQFHSGEQLARSLSVSRSAIWKSTEALRALGVALHAVRNRGYQLQSATELLDAATICQNLTHEARERVTGVETAWSIGSTNAALLARPSPAAGTSDVLLAEYQSAGRGRRGRSWIAPPCGAICLSLSWTLREVPQDIGALGLVVGVCALRALRGQGIGSARLKWPNDLLVGERKLGGALIDLRAEGSGPAFVVIGVGVNVALGAAILSRIAASGIAATDLASEGMNGLSRNKLAASLIDECVQGLVAFERQGLKPFIEEWREADALRGRRVDVSTVEAISRGVARGIDAHGALLVETRQGVRRFVSGDVTVRPA